MSNESVINQLLWPSVKPSKFAENMGKSLLVFPHISPHFPTFPAPQKKVFPHHSVRNVRKGSRLNGNTFFWGAGNLGKCGEIWGNTSTDLPIFSANIEGLTEGQSKSAAG